MSQIKFIIMGIYFGILLIKSDVASWFRIQKMFHFEEAHMYLVICSAVAVGMLSVFLIKKFKVRTINHQDIVISPKKFHRGNIIGGLLFGMGWIITGSCPGPIFAQIGAGEFMAAFTLIGALLGTLSYSYLKPKIG
ncbi:MAG: YeeE/YedE family protein [Deltaproteobacteria bacterium]|nr:YeeE/YedE family protein [Deltaproteobacteria bacterium]